MSDLQTIMSRFDILWATCIKPEIRPRFADLLSQTPSIESGHIAFVWFRWIDPHFYLLVQTRTHCCHKVSVFGTRSIPIPFPISSKHRIIIDLSLILWTFCLGRIRQNDMVRLKRLAANEIFGLHRWHQYWDCIWNPVWNLGFFLDWEKVARLEARNEAL